MAPPLVTIITVPLPPIGLALPYDEKKLLPNDLSFSKLKCFHVLEAEDTMIKVDKKRKLRKSRNKC